MNLDQFTSEWQAYLKPFGFVGGNDDASCSARETLAIARSLGTEFAQWLGGAPLVVYIDQSGSFVLTNKNEYLPALLAGIEHVAPSIRCFGFSFDVFPWPDQRRGGGPAHFDKVQQHVATLRPGTKKLIVTDFPDDFKGVDTTWAIYLCTNDYT